MPDTVLASTLTTAVSPIGTTIFGTAAAQVPFNPLFETTDAADSTATAYTMQVGQSAYGTIGSNTDNDWFRIDLVAGQTYEFRLLGVGNARLTDPLMRIRDSAGTTLISNDDAGAASWGGVHGQDSRLVFTATTTGTYYIEADAFSTETGSYLLTGVTQTPGGMEFTIDEIAWQLTNAGEAFFGSPEAAAFNVGVDGQLTFNVANLTAEGQTLARAALITWGDLTDITFVETAGAAEISFDDSDAGTTAYANTSITGTTINSSTVMITTGWLTQFGTTFNSYSYETYIHEIGHALGLAHGGNYNGSAVFGTDNYYLNDSLAYSIMSYMPAINDEFGAPNTFVNADFRYMLTPVLADFVAIDRLYGSSTNTRTGDTTYGYNSNTGNARLDSAVTIGADVNFMVHDNGGTDTLDFSGSSAAQTLNLNVDTLSSVLGGVFNLSISRESLVENAIGGSGVDTLIGNAAVNTLRGGAGNDRLIGGAGIDTLNGGANNDTIYVDVAGDIIVEAVGGGFDSVLSGASYTLAAGVEIERLSTTNIAGTGPINLTGNAFAQEIYGNNGANTLNGGIDNLRDMLTGYGGNDTYVINSALDVIVEAAGGGTGDRANASVSFTLAADDHIEVLQTTNAGLSVAINLTGNGFAQSVYGNAAGNVVNGGIDALRDTLIGYGGNDTYVINSTADLIVEGVGAGTADRAQTSVTFTLAADDDIEIFETTNAAGIIALGLTGNALIQSVTGNAGANVLNGGLGNDALTGLGGADNFLFNTALNATTNHDTITDFNVAADTIQLENAIFTLLAATGALAANLFESTSIAGQSGSEVVIYNRANGDLYYDTNGAATAGGLVLFADVANNTVLTAADFFVV